MRKQRIAAVEAVRSSFMPAEAAQDMAAAQTARCLADTLEARVNANLPIGTGRTAIALLARSTSLAMEAREAMIEAHAEFAKLPAAIGLSNITGWGPTDDDCVPTEPTGEVRAPLKAVA